MNTTYQIGHTATGEPVKVDLLEAPHTLITGTTGSGKSNLLHYIIRSLPTAVLLIDGKQGVELDSWTGHPKIIDRKPYGSPHDIKRVLSWLNAEIDRRNATMRGKARNIDEYNSTNPRKPLQRITAVIDEYQDILRGENKRNLERVAKMGRSAGIHLILATQRPTAQNTNSEIRAQAGHRIALHLDTKRESQIAIGTAGAEALPNKGDFILTTNHSAPIKGHTPLF